MENKAIEITAGDTPWEVACMLINAKYTYENMYGHASTVPMFNTKDLQKIGEHLMNFAKTECAEDG